MASEGLNTLSPFISKSCIITVLESDVVLLLKQGYPLFSEFSDSTREQFEKCEHGSILIQLNPTPATSSVESDSSTDSNNTETPIPKKVGLLEPILLPIWRAHVSASLLINKKERSSLMARITGEDLGTVVFDNKQ